MRDSARPTRTASIPNCFDPTVLQSLGIPGQGDGASTLDEDTDQCVKKWFDERLSSAPRNMAERVPTAVKCAKSQQFWREPLRAVLRFLLDIVAAFDRNNASSVVKDTEMCKSLVKKAVSKLEPPELGSALGTPAKATQPNRSQIFPFSRSP